MNADTLHAELTKQPFEWLRLHLTDGRTVDIRNPDVAVISNLSVYVFNVRKDKAKMADDTKIISIGHIVSIEHVETAPTN